MTLQAKEQPYSTQSDLMTPFEVMKHLKVSRATLHRYQTTQGLKSIRLGRARRFRLADVNAWLASREQCGGGVQG